ncbi:MAG TPA: LysE family translocator [Alphaproteobacteria bacterium]|nr:LysE family translocator [Alphaproteobacteria bacterium]
MLFHTWLVFAVTSALSAATPGPAVMVVLSQAMARGVRGGMAAAAGIATMNVAWIVVSMVGLGALLQASPALFEAVRWAGAAYLLWLGIKCLRAGPDRLDLDAAPRPRRSAYASGALVQMVNPKALVFFGALFPQFIDLEHGAAAQAAILGATVIGVELLVLLGFSVLTDRALRLVAAESLSRWRNRATGVLLMVAGVGLAILRN